MMRALIARRRRAAEAERIKGARLVRAIQSPPSPKRPSLSPRLALRSAVDDQPALQLVSTAPLSSRPRAAPPFPTTRPPSSLAGLRYRPGRPTTRSPHLTFRVSTTDHSALHASSVVSISGLAAPHYSTFLWIPHRQPTKTTDPARPRAEPPNPPTTPRQP